jgi:hypothetical protein
MGMDTKPRFYENILNRIYNDNQEMLNTVIFLKNLDCHDFAKNLTIPLLEKIGVHLWEHPSDKIIDDFLNNTLEGARARVKFIDGKTIVSGLRFKIKNIWINLYEAELESGNRMDVSRVIFNVLWREVLSEPINKHEDGEAKMVDVTSIINDKLRKEIRTELKDIMVFIHKNVYKETKNMIDSSEENMLSLLNIS